MIQREELSIENCNPDDIAQLVSDFYRLMLERFPDPNGMATYVSDLQQGMTLPALLASFLGSSEFMSKQKNKVLENMAGSVQWDRLVKPKVDEAPKHIWDATPAFPKDFQPQGEVGKCYVARLESGFFHRYCAGPVVIDVGFSGYHNPNKLAALPHAVGIDLDYPNYDGITLPFPEGSVDTVFSSHCLEHVWFDHAIIRDWFRVLKVGGFLVCMVPSQALYEKRRFLPSIFNPDHKRMYTPSSLLASFETSLEVNSYRVRHLRENDEGYDYSIGPETGPVGCLEIELVIEKLESPKWTLS